ncbi:MAG: hypothetical protein LBH00_08285 [Planctomycetaceae bacterium]|nr:hypothetical protein [Planctomycetaceae bacterium]
MSVKKGTRRDSPSILRHWKAENCLHLEKEESGEEKHVFRSAALGEVWTFLTGMTGAVGASDEEERAHFTGSGEQLRAKPQNARQMSYSATD